MLSFIISCNENILTGCNRPFEDVLIVSIFQSAGNLGSGLIDFIIFSNLTALFSPCHPRIHKLHILEWTSEVRSVACPAVYFYLFVHSLIRFSRPQSTGDRDNDGEEQATDRRAGVPKFSGSFKM